MAEEAADQMPAIPEEDLAEDVESQAPLVARAPKTPSHTEVELHAPAHYPYRSWCEHCVKGKGKDDCHRTVIGVFAESSAICFPIDYAYFTEDKTHKKTLTSFRMNHKLL